jgi:glycosyltransferase involved in cell wall biosynthesis
MDILIISPFFPLPIKSGGHTRVFNLIKHLSSRHNIDLLSLIREDEKRCIPDLMDLCRDIVTVNVDECIGARSGCTIRGNDLRRIVVRLLSLMKGTPLDVSGFYFQEMQGKLDAILKSRHYNVVQVELTRMAQYLHSSFYDRYPACKVIVDYDLDFVPLQRRYNCTRRPISKFIRYIDYRLHRFYALTTWPSFDRLVVMSQIDEKKVLDLLPRISTYVVPNGVDLNYFTPIPRNGGDNNLLFIGGTDHYPNIDALTYFLTHIFSGLKAQMSNLILTVIGSGWEKYEAQLHGDEAVRFTGYVEDIRPYASGQCIMIAPIRIGGGTRLKILEAMAMGVPVVSTSVGCEGIKAESGKHLMVADTPEEFVNAVVDIYLDEPLCHGLIENAYTLVRENYGWDKLALEMESVYHAEDSVASL